MVMSIQKAVRSCATPSKCVQPSNVLVHPARAVKVSNSKAPDRGLGYNDWFGLQSHQKYHVPALIKLAARAAIVPVP